MDNPANPVTLQSLLEFTLEELEALETDLDFFRAGRSVPERLLRAGLYPPLPVCGKRLIWGFPLISAARASGMARLACIRIDGLAPADMLALALQLEDRPGGYRWSEKRRMLAFAESAGFPLSALAPFIETHPDPRLEEKINRFSCLPDPLRAMVNEGLLDLRTALQIPGLPEGVLALTCDADLSFSERRAFLFMLRDLAGRRQLSPEQVTALAREALACAHPLEILGDLRSPVMADLKRRWAQLEQSLLAGSGVTLSPPASFEGDSFQVRFSFRSRQGLARKLRALARVEKRCHELFEFLG